MFVSGVTVFQLDSGAWLSADAAASGSTSCERVCSPGVTGAGGSWLAAGEDTVLALSLAL
jgi:hypothetical protein